MNILAISGSLRAASSNTTVLQALGLLLGSGDELRLYDGLGTLPWFNPDLDFEGAVAPPPVAGFRSRIAAADVVAICSPEYAHGVPGVLKNALDWTVASGEWMGKPVALINAAPRSAYAHESLRETLTVMSARVIDEASVPVPMAGRMLDAAGVAAAPDLADPLRRSIEALRRSTGADAPVVASGSDRG